MKVAIVHDWLTNMGGAERIIMLFHEMFPEAPIYTLFYNEANMPKEFKNMDIRTSYLQKLPFAKKKYQSLLSFMPKAVEQFDLSEYDLVLSSSTCCAKGVLTKSDTLHICYCNTPMRYAWDFYHEYINDKNVLVKWLIASEMKKIRIWDRISSDRVDYFIANSENVRKRIIKHYRRNSEVIFPPANTHYYTPIDSCEDYYLIVSRLVPYKKVDLAIEVFNELGLPLIIIGGGKNLDKYRAFAKPNVKLLGRLPDDQVREYYRKCKAFVFPGEEDYGITPVEAQSCGRPVIAYGKGGALETVVNNLTGIFFYEQTSEALKDAINRFESQSDKFDKSFIRNHALKYSEQVFKEKIKGFIDKKYSEFIEGKRYV